ncbi:hypothetical protein D3C85_1843190 [compost metagenome]
MKSEKLARYGVDGITINHDGKGLTRTIEFLQSGDELVVPNFKTLMIDGDINKAHLMLVKLQSKNITLTIINQ